MAEELWRQIKAAPRYAISNHGRVMRLRPGQGTRPATLVHPQKNNTGQLFVRITDLNGKRRSFSIAPLVAFAFVGPPPAADSVALCSDGDRENLNAANLVWGRRERGRYKGT